MACQTCGDLGFVLPRDGDLNERRDAVWEFYWQDHWMKWKVIYRKGWQSCREPAFPADLGILTVKVDHTLQGKQIPWGAIARPGMFGSTLTDSPFSVVSLEGKWSHPLCCPSYFENDGKYQEIGHLTVYFALRIKLSEWRGSCLQSSHTQAARNQQGP